MCNPTSRHKKRGWEDFRTQFYRVQVCGFVRRNEDRTSAAKAACAWKFYGTAKAVPFRRTSFHSSLVRNIGDNFTESRMKLVDPSTLHRKSEIWGTLHV